VNWEVQNETSPSPILASGRKRCRAAGRLADRAGASPSLQCRDRHGDPPARCPRPVASVPPKPDRIRTLELLGGCGGKFLSRTRNVKTLEGKLPPLALMEFPSAEAVEAFATDPKYAPYAAARKGGSESRVHLIDDTDLAGTIPYLPKG
jgi:uncharacterized protein (DUF1330 family)